MIDSSFSVSVKPIGRMFWTVGRHGVCVVRTVPVSAHRVVEMIDVAGIHS
jgi:hypothetical protein